MATSVTILTLWAWFNLVKYSSFPLIWSQWAYMLLYYAHYGHGLVWPGIAMSHLYFIDQVRVTSSLIL